MKYKILVLFVFALLCFSQTIAQKRKNVLLVTNSGRQVSTKDSADFIRIISEPDSGSILYNVNEYYKNGKLKLIGKSWKFDHLQFEGSCINFYPSGKRESITTYSKGEIVGDIYSYYPNGMLYTILGPPDSTHVTPNLENGLIIKLCNDSIGHHLAINGKGDFVSYSNDFKQVYEHGMINGGLRDGEWEGRTFETDSLTYTETYDKGKFISGESRDKSGNTYTYTSREVEPSPLNGIEKFYIDLGNKLHYPEESKESQTQGRVILRFIIEKDGSLTNFEILHTPDKYLGEEALRCVKLSPKWLPGTQYGKPVRIQFSIPVSFSLGDR